MGVSNKNAQDNIQPKGTKKDLKKPLQVVHLSKKATQQKYYLLPMANAGHVVLWLQKAK